MRALLADSELKVDGVPALFREPSATISAPLSLLPMPMKY